MEYELGQTAGIDKTRLYNITITGIDENKLLKWQSADGRSAVLEWDYMEYSPIVLKDGRRLKRLSVKGFFGKLQIAFKLNGLTGEFTTVSTLDLLIDNDGNNAKSLTAEDYRKRVDEVFTYLSNKVGVKLNYSDAELSRIEINKTVQLNDEINQYQRAILLLVRNITAFDGKSAEWRNHAINGKPVETILLKNNSRELKFYNKIKQLQDKEVIGDDNAQDLLRVEYTLKDRRVINRLFGGGGVDDLKDDTLENYFKQAFEKEVLENYRAWRTANHEQLLELCRQHKAKKQKWVPDFLRDCRRLEAETGMPVLFDLEDMRAVLKSLEPESKNRNKNARNKFRRFREQATYESDLQGHTARLQELIDKLIG